MCAASRPDCWAIIPARYASSRFPGKPLALIAGTPMVARVAARAGACRKISGVAVATDDERIRKVVEEHGVKAVMTSPDHPSGTDRVLEAARKLGLSGDSVIINVQGDEPGLDPELLLELTAPFVDPLVQVTTPARRITREEAQSPDLVKVVFASGGDALYFSRSRIPHERDQGKGAGADYYGHVGLYAFRMKALESFSALPTGRLEQVEKLEQLRLLENGIPIRVVLTEHAGVGVDRPEDIERAELLLARETEFR